MAPDGYKLLSDMVKRMYPTDDSVAQIENATVSEICWIYMLNISV